MVVGAGIAGVACARELVRAGIPVTVIDRGRRIGGRMAVRRFEDRPVDLGASYLTADDPAFLDVVEEWRDRGLAAPWTDRFTVLSPDGSRTTTGPVRWGAPGGLRSLVEDLAEGLEVVHQEVSQVIRDAEGLRVDAHPADAVVLAMPDAQAGRLLGGELSRHRDQLDRPSEPVLAVVARFAAHTWDDRSPDGRFHGAFVHDDDVLAWVADDGRRRGDDAPVLVAHTTPAFAARHLNDPAAAGPEVVTALCGLLDLPDPLDVHVHRWSLARPTGRRDAPYLLTDDGLGVCGDGWGHPPRVQTAWLSGRALGRTLVERLG